MVDFLEPYYTAYIDVFKPDLWSMVDDSCANEAPFFSVETYRKVMKPHLSAAGQAANDRTSPSSSTTADISALLDDMVDWQYVITRVVLVSVAYCSAFCGVCAAVGSPAPSVSSMDNAMRYFFILKRFLNVSLSVRRT